MYIMKLKPVLKELIWGGNRLKNEFEINTELEKIAEDWALTCHKQGKSIVENGEKAGQTLEEIIKNSKNDLVGTKGKKYPYFPILVKIIDAKDNLSIQVHPENKYALEHEGEYGKTEMWYVVDCDDGAELIYGFKNKITAEEFKKAIEENTLIDTLNTVKVKKGDVLFIEAGTVHAIGKGVLIAEIQQNSNTTYRVYDYNRKDAQGNARELHVAKAIDVSLTQPPTHPVSPQGKTICHGDYDETLLSECELFTVKKYDIKKQASISTDDTSFKHILIIDGNGWVENISFKKGDSFFVPADFGEFIVKGNCQIIVSNI